jgi:hypothetical protein
LTALAVTHFFTSLQLSLWQNERDPERVAALYNEGVKELAALKRGAIVNQLYGGWTLAVEKQSLRRERSDA